MAWLPIARTPIQYEKTDGNPANGYYLKFYLAGTTTPTAMATDTTGATQLAKCKLNERGFPISNASDETSIFIPHVNSAFSAFKYVIYQNSSDADANNFAAAIVNLNSVSQMDDVSSYLTGIVNHVATYADLSTDPTPIGGVVYLKGHTTEGYGNGIFDVVAKGAYVSDNGTIAVNATNNTAFLRRYKKIQLEFFGCVPGVTSNCSPMLLAALNLHVANRKKIETFPATYSFTDPVSITCGLIGINIEGDNTIFSYPLLPANASLITITGTPGQVNPAYIENITANGHSTSIFVECRGIGNQKLKKCVLGANAVGLLLHNFSAGQFTEYCTADECTFTSDCLTTIEYRKTGGDPSFHGSGLENRCKINTPTSGTHVSIIVGEDCLPYNSPLDAQVWGNVADAVLIDNRNVNPPINNCCWHGDLTVEAFSKLILATGNERTFLIGNVITNNEFVNYGVLKVGDAFSANSDGNVRIYPKNACKINIPLTTGANNIDLSWWAGFYGINPGYNRQTMAHVWVKGTNYYYSYLLLITQNPFGAAGSCNVLSTDYTFNTAGYGPPTFALNASNQLVITNASFPASGVDVNISLSNIGWDQPQY